MYFCESIPVRLKVCVLIKVSSKFMQEKPIIFIFSIYLIFSVCVNYRSAKYIFVLIMFVLIMFPLIMFALKDVPLNIYSFYLRQLDNIGNCFPNLIYLNISAAFTAWKASKYGVFSGLYSVRMRENTDQKKLRIWTLFT